MAEMSVQMFRRLDLIPEPNEELIQNLLQIVTTEGIDPFQHSSEQYGLFRLYTPAPHAVQGSQDRDFDIVAIHGLGGDAYRTWQHENGFNWLQHLHEEFPGIRVFSYGYDSGIAFSTGIASLTDYARHLLTLVKLTRSSEAEKKRRVVFVCHSMGGLLAKQAILLASSERGMYGAILEAICAVLFFATPHSGSALKYHREVLCNVADALLFNTLPDKCLSTVRAALLESLGSDAMVNKQLAEAFERQAHWLDQISSFIEKSSLPGEKDVLVDYVSGHLGHTKERVIPMLNHDHRQICKHPSMDSDGMTAILSELRDIIERDVEDPMALLQIVEPRDPRVIRETVKQTKNKAFLKAVLANNVFAVSRWVQDGVDINAKDDRLKTPLHLACQHGHTTVGILLLNEGADTNAIDNEGRHPIHYAAAKGDQLMVTRILEKGGDANAQDIDGWTPLHHAAEAGQVATTECLLAKGADCAIRNNRNELPVRIARRAHHLDVVVPLLKAGIGESKREDLMKSMANRPKSGYLTRSQGQAQWMAKNLPGVMLIDLDSGMDDAVREKAGTPGKFAEKGDLLSVEDILDMGLGASPETLYLAAKENRPDVVEVLVDMMDDIDVGVGELGNALCAAATYADGHSTLRVLLEHGANVNWQGGKYGCALQAATANYRLENVKLLLRYGADVNAQGGYYGNALTAAARHRTHFLSMAKLFLEHGVDVDAQGPGKYGNALQTAVHRKHVENVKFLLQNGASRTVKGRFGSAQMIAWSPDFSDGSDEDAQEDILAMLTEDEFVGFITER